MKMFIDVVFNPVIKMKLDKFEIVKNVLIFIHKVIFNNTYFGAAILSGSDPPISLETILPVSRAFANSILESSPKIPNFDTLTAFSGTCSLTSSGT